jgi:hypothetical protein
MKEPPWVTSPEQLEPLDDTGHEKKRPTLEQACVAFREQFINEPWFVRVMATHEDAGYFVLIADARSMPAKTKMTGWMGYGVAVALVTGAVADAERKVEIKPRKGKEEKIVEAAIQAYYDKYKANAWLIGVDGFITEEGDMTLDVKVDAARWKWGVDAPPFEHNGRKFDVVLVMLPKSMLGDEDANPFEEQSPVA